MSKKLQFLGVLYHVAEGQKPEKPEPDNERDF